MPSWIDEDPPAIFIGLVLRLACAQIQEPCLGLIQVVDVEVEVDLLGNGLVRPVGSPVVVDALETDEASVLAVETGKIGIGLRMRFKAGGLLIEGRQR